MTVCIALLGMFALGLTFLYGVSLGAAFVVLLTMLSSLTLLPAMLGFYGAQGAVASRPTDARERTARRGQGPTSEVIAGRSPFWSGGPRSSSDGPPILSVLGLALIVVVALPFFSMRLGLADSGEDPSGSTTKLAYDLLAQGFGPGFNGPLQVVGKINGPGDLARFDSFVDGTPAHTGCRPRAADAHQPQRQGGRRLRLSRLQPAGRADDDPRQPHSRRGARAPQRARRWPSTWAARRPAGIDFSKVLAEKLPLFIAVIVVLAFLLLAAVFRSLLVPLMASVMNILSIGAALGAITAAFQFGWLQPVLGFSKAGPIEVYLPVHDVRRPVRALDGLRGLPRQPDARGVGQDR